MIAQAQGWLEAGSIFRNVASVNCNNKIVNSKKITCQCLSLAILAFT